MRPYRLHVLYEHGFDLRPYVSSHVRLLRPLSHPSIRDSVRLTSGTELCDDHVDVVLVDRQWKPGVTVEQAEQLADEVRRRSARLVYSLDDQLLALQDGRQNPAGSGRRVVEAFLRAADRVLITTESLRAAVEPYNASLTVIPNFLDERLLGERASAHAFAARLGALRQDRSRIAGLVTIGYMGTLTHDADLRTIAAALQRVCKRHEHVRLELVGGIADRTNSALIRELPWAIMEPGQIFTEYPSFLPWFTAMCRWDLALAPLADTVFTRCKSDIKFLDYAAIGAAGIFSKVPTYTSVVEDGVTGFLVDNDVEAWEVTVERVIADPALGVTVGYLAQNYLHESRTLAQGAVQWLDLIRQCLEE